jgi:hypothetical protein
MCIPEKSGVCANYDASEPPVPCSGTFLQSAGYRLVVDSRCDPTNGGLDLRPVEVTCPGVDLDSGSHGGLVVGVLITVVLLIALVCGAGYYLRNNREARDKLSQMLGGINLNFLAPGDEDSQQYSRLGVSDALLDELSDEEEADLIEDLPLDCTLASEDDDGSGDDGNDIILLDN